MHFTNREGVTLNGLWKITLNSNEDSYKQVSIILDIGPCVDHVSSIFKYESKTE